MTHFYLARHGQTDWNKAMKVQGITDIPLNQKGLEQAQELAHKIKTENIKIDEILHSPLIRAAETARIIGKENGIICRPEPRLIEQNFGKYEGFECVGEKRFEFYDAKEHFLDSYEGGESMMRLGQRIYNFLDEIKSTKSDKTYLFITHGGIVRCIQSYFCDMTNNEYASFSLGNCELKEYIFN